MDKTFSFMCLPTFSRDQLANQGTQQLMLVLNDLERLRALVEAELTLRGEF